MKKGLRIEVPEDLHNIIRNEQSKRKAATGKITPLADIMLEYFKVGLLADLAGFKADTRGNVQNNAHTKATSQVENNALGQTQRDIQLEDKESSLNALQINLRNKENDLRCREGDLYKKYDEFHVRKSEFLTEKETFWEKVVENRFDKEKIKDLEENNKKKHEEIKQLKEQIKSQNAMITITLENIEDKLDNKPDNNMWRDWVIPSLSPVLLTLFYFSSNKTIESVKDIKPLMSEIENILKETDSAKLKSFFESLNDIFNSSKGKRRK